MTDRVPTSRTLI